MRCRLTISKNYYSWLRRCLSETCLSESNCGRVSVPELCRYLRVPPPANIPCASGTKTCVETLAGRSALHPYPWIQAINITPLRSRGTCVQTLAVKYVSGDSLALALGFLTSPIWGQVKARL